MVLTAADESDSAIETKRWCATVVMIGVVETFWRHEIVFVLSVLFVRVSHLGRASGVGEKGAGLG